MPSQTETRGIVAATAPTRQTPSIEAVIIGRNDDYEPNWADRLKSALTYNFDLMQSWGIDYRVAFIEWNPPGDSPLLAPELVRQFPGLRAIVIDADIHARLCAEPGLSVMLNFAFNSGFRTSKADFMMTATGDVFYGRALVERIASEGLTPGIIYRAERANIRNDLDFARVDGEVIEDSASLVGVDTVSEPYYLNACGDFILMDRATMLGIRGLDESVRKARLGLDSRLCLQAVSIGHTSTLLGRIYHIDHHNSYRNRPDDYPGQPYDCTRDLPYLNRPDWGLASFDWHEEDERLVRISLPGAGGNKLPGIADTAVREVTERLIKARVDTTPSQPVPGDIETLVTVPVEEFRTPSTWPGATLGSGTAAVVHTARDPWSYASVLPLEPMQTGPGRWVWAELDVRAEAGAVGISLFHEGEIFHERAVFVAEGRTILYLPIDRAGGRMGVLVRNYAREGESIATVASAKIVAQAPPDYADFL